MLERFAERCKDNLAKSVIPFWLSHAVDRRHGGVYTCLDREGRVFDTRKYVWLQGRAIWMFSRLYNEFERREEYLEIAAATARFLRAHAYDDQGRVYFALTEDGRPAAFQRKVWSAGFFAEGLSEYYRATGDKSALAEALTLYDRIVMWMADHALLGRPALPGAPPTASLGDSSMAEALFGLQFSLHSDDARFERAMKRSIEAARLHYDPALRVFREFVLTDESRRDEWNALPESRYLIPGHSIEMVWFLLRVLRKYPSQADLQMCLDALEGSLEFAWDREYGGIYYFMDVEGRPTLPVESTMKLWWPHNEALYSLVMAYALTRDPKWLAWLERVEQYSFRVFSDDVFGEWYGYCDRRGVPTSTAKGGSYKGFYHVPRALLYCWQEIERMNGR
jgi:N-acylglucosamine 2-epimerase